MRKHLYFIALFCLSVLCAHAQTIILRTGARVRGEIIFQNEEVVILRDADGKRFQYLRSDVEDIVADQVEEKAEEDAVEEPVIKTAKQASILLEIAGGAAVHPNESAGGAVSADLIVGSHHIADRHIFIGGGVGYHGLFMRTEKYHFLPIQVALRMPFMETKHAPMFGASLGYGVALSKEYVGGIYAGADFGYRCQLNQKTAVALSLYAQFQQAKIPVTIVIDDVPYAGKSTRALVATGIKLSLYF